MKRKIIAAGNWKMNSLPKASAAILEEMANNAATHEGVISIIFPPATHLSIAAATLDQTQFQWGGQNCSQFASGAYTGEVSVSMLADLGCTYSLVGHSERRAYYGETDEILAAKVSAVLDGGLTPVFCIGETLEERTSGIHFEVVRKQLEKGLFHLSADAFSTLVIAYEPVWAIGTGKTASPEQAQEIHAYIREVVREKYGETVANTVPVLYGGSVNPANALELFLCPDIDGGLVGGASLKAADFTHIIQAAADAYDRK